MSDLKATPFLHTDQYWYCTKNGLLCNFYIGYTFVPFAYHQYVKH